MAKFIPVSQRPAVPYGELRLGVVYECDSGMGGAFDIKITAFLGGGAVGVKVHMPRNPDWHGYTFQLPADQIKQAV